MPRMQIEIRDARAADLDAVLALSEAVVPAVNSVPMAQLEKFQREAVYFRVALAGGDLAGYLIGLTPNADYPSPNIPWFRRRYRDFGYVDRLEIASIASHLAVGM